MPCLALFAAVPDTIAPMGATVFFVARSYNAQGLESVNSNEVQWTRPMPTPTAHAKP